MVAVRSNLVVCCSPWETWPCHQSEAPTQGTHETPCIETSTIRSHLRYVPLSDGLSVPRAFITSMKFPWFYKFPFREVPSSSEMHILSNFNILSSVWKLGSMGHLLNQVHACESCPKFYIYCPRDINTSCSEARVWFAKANPKHSFVWRIVCSVHFMKCSST